jgi:hypothetical protein
MGSFPQNAGLADPALNARLGEFGGTALKGTPAEFESLFAGDAQKWAIVMRAANIKPEQVVFVREKYY